MKNRTAEQNDPNELMELTGDSTQQVLSPVEEYRKAARKRRGKALLFSLLVFLETFLCLVLFGSVLACDLNIRVPRHIESKASGKIELSTGTYTGETDFGYFFGNGVFAYNTGSVYTGQWDNNLMQGVGVLEVPSEGTYEGEFVGSQKSGTGVFTWDDGAIYSGEWKNDQMDGQGTYNSPDGVTYEGTFKENRFWAGSCHFSNETGLYTAQYKDWEIDNLSIQFSDGTTYNGATDGNTLCGQGTMRFPGGDVYTGNYANGMRDGQGTYTWDSGESYNGTWKADSMHGSGIYKYSDGSCAQGEFKKNQFIDGSYQITNAFGEYTFTISNGDATAVEMVLNSGTTYSGEMADGKLTGSAQITYSNGDQYSGRVDNGYKAGQGTYIWSSGASYEGDWENDKMNGQGTYFYSDKETGYKLIGNFEKGVPNGECQYYLTESEYYKTDWNTGKCVKIYE